VRGRLNRGAGQLQGRRRAKPQGKKIRRDALDAKRRGDDTLRCKDDSERRLTRWRRLLRAQTEVTTVDKEARGYNDDDSARQRASILKKGGSFGYLLFIASILEL
jgi:hypothetical protein